MSKGFASSADNTEKKISFTRIGSGLYAFTAEGDPNSGVIVGDDAVMVGTTPSRPRIRGPSRAGSIPNTRSEPSLTGETQPIMRMVELFPAPLGPRNPNTSPWPTSKSTASTAVNVPNRLVRPRARISAFPISETTAPRD